MVFYPISQYRPNGLNINNQQRYHKIEPTIHILDSKKQNPLLTFWNPKSQNLPNFNTLSKHPKIMSKTIRVRRNPYIKIGAQGKKMKKLNMLQNSIFSDQSVALGDQPNFYKGRRERKHSN